MLQWFPFTTPPPLYLFVTRILFRNFIFSTIFYIAFLFINDLLFAGFFSIRVFVFSLILVLLFLSLGIFYGIYCFPLVHFIPLCVLRFVHSLGVEFRKTLKHVFVYFKGEGHAKCQASTFSGHRDTVIL